MQAERVVLQEPAFVELNQRDFWHGRPWPAQWIHAPEDWHTPVVMMFCRRFALTANKSFRLHISADERYQLYVDGVCIGRGPTRGDKHHWHYESYDLKLSAGDHVVAVRVWGLGPMAPEAQMSFGLGLVVATEDVELGEALNTGKAAWRVKKLAGYGYQYGASFGGHRFVGPGFVLDATTYPWGCETGEGEGWGPVRVGHVAVGESQGYGENYSNHFLTPSPLPAMLEQPIRSAVVRHVSAWVDDDPRNQPIMENNHRPAAVKAWQALVDGQNTLVVPAQSKLRVLLDLGRYYCAYNHLSFTGGRGAKVEFRWSESLFYVPGLSPQCGVEVSSGAGTNTPQRKPYKGDRAAIEGKCSLGSGDRFLPGGSERRRMEGLWWRCGRFVELVISTEDEPVTLHEVGLLETRYPLENQSTFTSDDATLKPIIDIGFRSMQMCAHETYMDCPYYEQLMYVGDTRLEVLTTFITNVDDRLPRHAVALFNASRLPHGLTQSRYPSRDAQIIGPFALWWVLMVHDWMMWRGDRAFIQAMLPGVRGILQGVRRWVNPEGLLQAMPGWNFVDWVPEWEHGTPPMTQAGVNGVLQWQYLLSLQAAAELELWAGEAEYARLWERQATELYAVIHPLFWRSKRELYAETPQGDQFSQHSQCLAILSRRLPADQARKLFATMWASNDLAQTTVYFRHYVFEAAAQVGMIKAFFEGLNLWRDFLALGCTTTLESPEPTRSDCHAWGAHPIYHLLASVLGIRPAAPGFASVLIRPQLGPLQQVQGSLPHPLGRIELALQQQAGRWTGRLTLPDGLSGELILPERSLTFAGGTVTF